MKEDITEWTIAKLDEAADIPDDGRDVQPGYPARRAVRAFMLLVKNSLQKYFRPPKRKPGRQPGQKPKGRFYDDDIIADVRAIRALWNSYGTVGYTVTDAAEIAVERHCRITGHGLKPDEKFDLATRLADRIAHPSGPKKRPKKRPRGK